MREEVQEILHQTFNLLETARRAVHQEGDKLLPQGEAVFLEKLDHLVTLLNENYEQLRSRVLPMIG
jgi:hypothetical protein